MNIKLRIIKMRLAFQNQQYTLIASTIRAGTMKSSEAGKLDGKA
jgi:hypothetical protein